MSRGLFIDIKKIEENEEQAVYLFSTRNGNSGKVAIHKKTGECFVIEEPEYDKESELAVRVGLKLLQHWRRGEYPNVTSWAS